MRRVDAGALLATGQTFDFVPVFLMNKVRSPFFAGANLAAAHCRRADKR